METVGRVRGSSSDRRAGSVHHRYRNLDSDVGPGRARATRHVPVAIPRRFTLDRHARRGAHGVGPGPARAVASSMVGTAARLRTDTPGRVHGGPGPFAARAGRRLARRCDHRAAGRHPGTGGSTRRGRAPVPQPGRRRPQLHRRAPCGPGPVGAERTHPARRCGGRALRTEPTQWRCAAPVLAMDHPPRQRDSAVARVHAPRRRASRIDGPGHQEYERRRQRPVGGSSTRPRLDVVRTQPAHRRPHRSRARRCRAQSSLVGSEHVAREPDLAR